MSDFNENNNQNEIPDSQVTENKAEDIQPVQSAEPVIDGAEIISGVEAKRKKGPAAVIAVIVAVLIVLAGGSAAAYNLSPWVKNNVKMLINDPEEYYAWVENENMDSAAEAIADAYDSMTGSDTKNVNMELNANLETDAVAALIEESAGVSLADAGITIPGNISFTEGGSVVDGYTAVNAKLNADSKTLMTVNGYLKDGSYYYQVPELSSSYIKMDLNQIMEAALAESGLDASVGSLFTDMATGKGLQEILTDKELEELITKYFNIVFTNIKDVELEKGVECEVNGVKAKYSQLTADIDEGALYGILKDVLKEAKNDKTIIKIVESTGAMTKDEYTAAVDSLLEQMGEYSISGGDTVVTMNVFVDSKGIIMGRSFEIPDSEEIQIDYMTVENDNDLAFELNVAADGEGVKVNGDMEEKSEKVNGTIKADILGTADGDMSFEIGLKDIKKVNEEKGYCTGEISVNLSSFGLGEIAVNLDSDGKSQEIATEIVADGTKYADISLKYSDAKPEDITPFNESEQVYNYTEDGGELNQYIESADLEGFLKGISDVIGIDLNSLMDLSGGYDDPYGIDSADDTDDLNSDNYDDYTYPESVQYDFTKIKMQLNGKDIALPGKIDGVLDKVEINKTSIDAGMYEYFYSEDGSVAVYLENQTDASLAPEECTITGISVTDESDLKLTVDGIGAGSNIADAVSKFGCKLEDEKSGYTYIENTNNDEYYGEITFFYNEGIIYEVDVDFY